MFIFSKKKKKKQPPNLCSRTVGKTMVCMCLCAILSVGVYIPLL